MAGNLMNNCMDQLRDLQVEHLQKKFGPQLQEIFKDMDEDETYIQVCDHGRDLQEECSEYPCCCERETL